MIDVLAPLALLGLAGFVAAFVWTARKQRDDRHRLFRDLAAAHRWRFLERDDGTARRLAEGFREFSTFRYPSRGERPPENVILGEVDEGMVCVFSHVTRRHEGDARLWTVCLIESEEEVAPDMTIRPRSARRPLMPGGEPEVRTGDPRFDEAYEVRAPDPTGARDALGQSVRRVLLHSRTRRLPFPTEVQVRGRRVAVYPATRNDAPESDDQLEALVAQARRLVRAFDEALG